MRVRMGPKRARDCNCNCNCNCIYRACIVDQNGA